MNEAEILKRLAELGFAADDLETATTDYQSWHGDLLVVDGNCGPITQRHLEMPRFCALPDRLLALGEMSKFPGRSVTYANSAAAPGFSLATTQAITDLAIQEWNTTSGMKAVRAPLAQAVIVLGVGQIDGPNKVLAWSELANTPKCKQLYDQAEPWKRGQGWTAIPYPAIDLLIVMLHELGHAFGLDHAPGSSHLLSPIYSPANVRPGEWEIDEMRKRYGPPVAQPPPPPNPPGTPLPPSPPGGEMSITLRAGQRVTVTATH